MNEELNNSKDRQHVAKEYRKKILLIADDL